MGFSSLWILLFSMTLTSLGGVLSQQNVTLGANPEVAPQKEIQNIEWFKIENRSEPLLLCFGVKDAFNWRPSKIPTCDIPLPSDGPPPIIVNITTWWPELTAQKITGFECRSRWTKIRKSFFFWGSYSENTESGDGGLSTIQCNQMFKHHLAPTGKMLYPKGNGIYSTLIKRDAPWVYANTKNYYFTDYYLTEFTIGVLPENQKLFTAAQTVRDCSVDEEICKTKSGWLVWNAKDVKKCFLKPLDSVVCAVTDDMVTCPGKSIALSELKPSSACRRMIGTSVQGVMFTPDDPHDTGILQRISTTDEFLPLVVSTKKSKAKRDAMFSPTSSINAQIQYIHELIRHNTTTMLYDVHKRICLNNAMLLESNLFLAKAGNPSILVASVFGDDHRAVWVGDVLSIIKCHSVYQYGFEIERLCMEEWPVRYQIQGESKELVGYLGPNHEIMPSFTPSDCTVITPFYFTYLDVSYLISAEAEQKSIPVLPNPGKDDMKFELMKRVSITGPAVYSAEEIGGNDLFRTVFREGYRPGYVDREVALVKQGKAQVNGDILGDLEQILIQPLYDYVKFIALIVCGVLAAIMIFFILYWCGILHLIFKRLHSCCCNCAAPTPTANIIIQTQLAEVAPTLPRTSQPVQCAPNPSSSFRASATVTQDDYEKLYPELPQRDPPGEWTF